MMLHSVSPLSVFSVYRRIVEKSSTDVEGIALNCSPNCVPAVGMYTHTHKKKKKIKK